MGTACRGSRRQSAPAVRIVLSCVVLFCSIAAFADELTLKDGTVLRGAVDTPAELRGFGKEGQPGFIRVDNNRSRSFIHSKQLAHTDRPPQLDVMKPFRISQPVGPRSQSTTIENLVNIVEITPFDENGRRKYIVRDTNRQVELVQGITEIHPDYVKLECLNYPLESSVATATIPQETLEKILRKVTNPKNFDARLRLTHFFIRMEWFALATRELKAIEQEFREFSEQAREMTGLLDNGKKRWILGEIKLRRGAGQHSFAYQALKEFPVDGAPGDVLIEVRDLLKQYEATIERMQSVQREMVRLRGEVNEVDTRERLSAPLEEIAAWLHVENVARLEPFLAVVDKKDIAPEDRLGAAISGWLVGSPFAEANADRALRLWDARAKILEFMREPNETRRQKLLTELRVQETISVDLAAHILEFMPPVNPDAKFDPAKPATITIELVGGRKIEYSVLLPMEYNPFHQYPVIMTLHAQQSKPEEQIAWWAFHASRHGYIVVAPNYVDDPKKGYKYDVASHDAVLHALIDVRRRFSVDSDRVFLSGFSMGGNAAWDIGLAHPDLFAGVMPICGKPQFFCNHYWPNAEQASFYVVDGEKNGQNPDLNVRLLKRMMENGYDALYVEYRGRGNEGFGDETLRLFDWMSRKTRHKFPLSFSCRSSRPTDNEFYYVSVDGFDANLMMDPVEFDRKKIKTAQLDGRITGTANSIQIKLQGPKKAELWLSPGMVDLNQPVTVRLNGEIKHHKLVTLDLEALLEDFRVRADRQKLFYAKLSFPRI